MYGTSKNKFQNLEQELEKVKESELKMLESLKAQTKKFEQTKIDLEESKLEIKTLKETIKVLESKPIGAQLKENDNLRTMLRKKDEELRIAKHESKRLKNEAEESSLSWREKENGFLKCVSLCEEKMVAVKEENKDIIESQKSARREVSMLRDILKQAVNEATVTKESLEIARKENRELKDSLKEKENAVHCMKQELESLKVCEAAALNSVKQLQNMIDAISCTDLNKSAIKFEGELPRLPPKAMSSENARVNKKNLLKSPSPLGPHGRNARRYSFGDSFGVFDQDKKDKEPEKNTGIAFGEGYSKGPDTPTRLMVKNKKRDAIKKKLEGFLRWKSFHK